MKTKTLVITGIAAAVLAVGGGLAYANATSRPSVSVAVVTSGELTATVSASGSVQSAHTAGVYAPAAGTIATLLVADGDRVAAGDELAKLDPAPLKLAVAQAKAGVSAAVAQLDAVNRGVPAAIDRSAANAALSAARSQVSTAQKNYAAYLSEYHNASSAEQDAMRATLRTLKTAKATANAALKSAQAGLSQLSRAARVGLARTAASDAAAAARRALDVAQSHLAHATLVAPFTGTVQVPAAVEPGAGVAPGVAVFTVTDPAKLRFDAAVSETDIAAIAADQTASVTLDAFDTPFVGTVTRVHGDAQTAGTGGVTFTVEVSLDPGDQRVFAGMSGSADIATQTVTDALLVPVEAVLTRGDAPVVFVVGGDSVAHSRSVEVGVTTDSSAQITSGLAEGERVVTVGAGTLTDGQQVQLS